jgi:hypothetical protein
MSVDPPSNSKCVDLSKAFREEVATHEGWRLVSAFRRIKDLNVRASLLEFVERLAASIPRR